MARKIPQAPADAEADRIIADLIARFRTKWVVVFHLAHDLADELEELGQENAEAAADLRALARRAAAAE